MIKKLMICPYFGTLPPWFDSYLANIEMLKPLGYDWHITTNLKLFKERVGDILEIKCPIVPGTGKLWDYRPAFGVLFAEELKRYDYWGHTDFDCVYGRVDRFVTDEFLGLATPRVESRRDPAVVPRGLGPCLMLPTPPLFGPMAYCAWPTCGCPGERPKSVPLPPEAVSPNKKVLDIHSNHHNYICGPWSLYRNRDAVNGLFQLVANWQEFLVDPEPKAWIEKIFTSMIDWAAQQGSLTRKYTHWQEINPHDTSGITMAANGGLLDRIDDRNRATLNDFRNTNGDYNQEIMMCHFRHTKEYPKGVKFV